MNIKMAEKSKNIGIKVNPPKKECTDKKCPFHGDISVRGRMFTGRIIKKDVHRSATVEWARRIQIPKYERYQKKRTKIHVHNPPCIDAKEGDNVKIMECKPISKTKNFVIVEDLGKQFGFEQMEEARDEAKQTTKKKEIKPAEEKIKAQEQEMSEEKTDESS